MRNKMIIVLWGTVFMMASCNPSESVPKTSSEAIEITITTEVQPTPEPSYTPTGSSPNTNSEAIEFTITPEDQPTPVASYTPSEDVPNTNSEAIGVTITAEVQSTPVPSYTEGAVKPGQQSAFSFQSSSGEEIKYFLYLPEMYDEDQPWPLILSLHGFLGFNHNLESVRDQNPATWVGTDVSFPFILVAPLGPDGLWSEYHKPMEELLTLLNETLSIDKDAIFLTGLSAGGTGAWQWALAFPDRFAGVAIVAGSPTFHSNDPTPENICLLKDLPMWISYSNEDLENLIETTNAALAALKECGNHQIHLTAYSDISHSESIRTTYEGPELYQWMLEQVKK